MGLRGAVLILGPKNSFASKDKRVDEILELTKSENIKWELQELDRQKWSISFNAAHESNVLILSKSSEAPGRWYISEHASLEAKTGAGKNLWGAAYYNKYDYAETLDSGGDIDVELLAGFVIEKFRKKLDLHWSIK